MSEAVRRCCLGWKCNVKYVRGGIHIVNHMREYDMLYFTPGKDCGPLNAM